MPPIVQRPFHPGARAKSWFFVGLGFAVPGADLLANVAAKNPGVQGVGHFTRKRSVQLNGSMADAAAAINNHWSNDGLGRAGVDAARAAPAMVRHGKVWNKIRQIKIKVGKIKLYKIDT